MKRAVQCVKCINIDQYLVVHITSSIMFLGFKLGYAAISNDVGRVLQFFFVAIQRKH